MKTQATSHQYIGTSGWTYDHWQGPIYPQGITGAKRLLYYASLFGAVEVNATFYRFPTNAMIAAWNKTLPDDFCLAIKGSRRITHVKGLPDAERLAYFLSRIDEMRHARVVLWQMPPTRAYDAAYLDGFLAMLKDQSPKRLRHAIECRAQGWWCKAAYAAMAAHNVAFVAISHPSLPHHFVQTADFTYVRLHGRDAATLYCYDYSPSELSLWARRLRPGIKAGQDAFVFFNNDIGAHAVPNAQAIIKRLQHTGA